MKVGYARTSTTDQNIDPQRSKLQDAGCERIFEEQVSGKSAEDREQLQAMLTFIRDGDVLVVTKLDRLARSLPDLFEIVKTLEKKGAQLVVLNNAAIDTTTSMGRCLFGIFGAIAQFERDLIRERQHDGIQAAKQRDIYKGRKPTVPREDVVRLKQEGMGPAEIARTLKIGESSVFRVLRGVTDSARA